MNLDPTGRNRCYTFWQEFHKCYALADKPEECVLQRDDYLECLHHSKEVNGITKWLFVDQRGRAAIDGLIRFRYRYEVANPQRKHVSLVGFADRRSKNPIRIILTANIEPC